MIKLIIILLVINFISDQLFQPKQVLVHKDRNTIYMFIHVMVWAVSMIAFACVMIAVTGKLWPLAWVSLAIFAHFLIEWPLSRWASNLFYKKDYSLAITLVHMEKLLLNVYLLFSLLYFVE